MSTGRSASGQLWTVDTLMGLLQPLASVVAKSSTSQKGCQCNMYQGTFLRLQRAGVDGVWLQPPQALQPLPICMLHDVQPSAGALSRVSSRVAEQFLRGACVAAGGAAR
jgi:hypothetical protein